MSIESLCRTNMLAVLAAKRALTAGLRSWPFRSIISIIALLLGVVSLAAQVDSRVQEIEAARTLKTQQLQPDIPSNAERALSEIKDRKILERFSAGVAGFRLKLGGIVTGSGFAFGPEYLRRDLWSGEAIFRTAAQASFRGYQKYDVQFTVPSLQGSGVFLDLRTFYRNYPSLQYYGPGPDSSKGTRTNFRMEDAQFNGTLGFQPIRHLSIGASLGYSLVNVGPGTDSRFASAEQVFTPSQAPGINEQADFLRSSVFVQYDYRDNPGGPRAGGNYLAEFASFSDRTLHAYSFQRLDVQLQQYLPFFNERRVIALRAKTVLTFTNAGQLVPFYLQPIVGGSEDLRGFRAFRFYDNNTMVLNAEYRWETFSGLDMALFADAGKVFPTRGGLNFRDLESSVGLGWRFNVRNNVFFRLDAGFSHEGFQVWFKFNNIFSDDAPNARSDF